MSEKNGTNLNQEKDTARRLEDARLDQEEIEKVAGGCEGKAQDGVNKAFGDGTGRPNGFK